MANVSSGSSSSANAVYDAESVKEPSLVLEIAPRRMKTRSTVNYQKFEGKKDNLDIDSSTESEGAEGGEEEEGKSNEVAQPSTDSEEEPKDCSDKIGDTGIDEDEPPYLTGKPRFDVVLEPRHLSKPLYISKKIRQLLPCAEMPFALRYHGKTWHVMCNTHGSLPRFYCANWKSFLKENGLLPGDALVFELMESSVAKVEFKVQILRCDVPPELLAYVGSHGEPTNPISID